MAADGPADRAEPLGPEQHEPILDLDHLFGFTDGDPGLEGELCALFLSSAAIYLGRMSEALESGDSWQETAHALKGASANLGARRVAALARSAEQSMPTEPQLDAIRRAVEEVRVLFAVRLGQLEYPPSD